MTTTIAPEKLENTELTQKPKLPENKNHVAIFPDGKSEATTVLENSMEPLRAKLKTLHGLQSLDPTNKERAKEIIDIERQIGRIQRFSFLWNKWTPEQKEILKGKDTLEKLKASDVLLLKKKGVDLANLLLVPVGTDPTKSTNRDFIEKGEHKNFIVNFWENKDGKNDIDNIIGAGDILPPTVSRIRVNGVEGERKIPPEVKRPGYYNKGEYLDIHDGNNIGIVKLGSVDDTFLTESNKADEAWLRERRIEDMIDNKEEPLSTLQYDIDLKKEAQEEIKQRKEIRESIGTMRKGKFSGTTDKPISETVKALKDLNVAETNNLLKKVFGEWPGTNLLIAIDNGSTFAIKRMIALAYHEGGLVFGRQNLDPASGFNIGTFQIGWTNSTRESSMNKYESCLQGWIRLAWQKNIAVDYKTIKDDPAQRDLITHLWYIQFQRGGDQTFARLRDSSLSDGEIVSLMHHDIQWGIPAIGHSVVAQVNNTKIDLTQIQSA